MKVEAREGGKKEGRGREDGRKEQRATEVVISLT